MRNCERKCTTRNCERKEAQKKKRYHGHTHVTAEKAQEKTRDASQRAEGLQEPHRPHLPKPPRGAARRPASCAGSTAGHRPAGGRGRRPDG